MDLIVIFVVSVPLLLIAAGMIFWHIKAWRSYQQQELEEKERNFRWRQFRRRMQTSVMLALLAVAFPVGDALSSHLSIDWVGWLILYWLATVLLACWIVLLGLVDIWATRHYFGRMEQKDIVEQIKIQVELRRQELLQKREESNDL